MDDFKITVDSGSTDDLLDLNRWMRNEEDSRLHPVRESTSEDGTMGLSDYLILGITAEVLTALTTCICAWIRYRRPKVTVTVGQVTVSGDAKAAAAELEKLLKHE